MASSPSDAQSSVLRTLRLLTPRDAKPYLSQRQRCLALEPRSFITSPPDDLACTVRKMRLYLDHAPTSVVIGAFEDRLVGSVGVHRDRLQKCAHRAKLWGLYVEPSSRGNGVGRGLLEFALEYAQSLAGVQRLHLGVSEASRSARRLFEQAGFRDWSVEQDVFRHSEEPLALHHMSLELPNRTTSNPC